MSILVVDDSRESRELLATLLGGFEGQRVRAAASAQEGLAVMEGEDQAAGTADPVDLVLLDVAMPDMDGIETCQRIKLSERGQDVPVLMVTAEDDVSCLRRAFAAGAMDYITKPFDKLELLTRVRAALRLKGEMDRRRQREAELLEANRELDRINRTLQDALSEIKVLRGLLPICASCKKIRDDAGQWKALEVYIQDRSEATFTHGICPACAARDFPGL